MQPNPHRATADVFGEGYLTKAGRPFLSDVRGTGHHFVIDLRGDCLAAAAPFSRNTALLYSATAGVIAAPGTTDPNLRS